MKNILAAGLIALPSLFATAQKTVTLDGEFKNIGKPVDKVFLMYQVGEESVMDSVAVKNNKYRLTLKLQEPTIARLVAHSDELEKGEKNVAFIFLDLSNMKVLQSDSLTKPIVTGSKANDEFRKLFDSFKPLTTQRNELIKEYLRLRGEQNEAGMEAIGKQIDALDSTLTGSYGTYAEKNPTSPIAVFALQQFAGPEINVEKMEPLFNKLSQSAKNSPSGKQLAAAIDIAKKTSIGQVAMDFTQADTAGVPVKLSQFRGKYVLLDFWASWCGPCRMENPNVAKAYNTFKDKGFTVLGVSLDRENARDKWIKAIHDDKLTWTHVSDLKFWNNAVAKAYGIKAIPQNLLLDPEGKIVAKNIKGEELQSKLEEILK